MKTPPLAMTQDNFCAVLSGLKTETRRLSNGSDKARYLVDDRCYLTEPTQIESSPDLALHSVVNYFWNNPGSLWKAITFDDKIKIESRKSGIKSKQIARFMLKSFARYWVEITEVNQERLLDITAEAAIAEGTQYINTSLGRMYLDYVSGIYKFQPVLSYLSEIAAIHPASKDKIGGWDLVNSNPCVWAYKFKLIGEN